MKNAFDWLMTNPNVYEQHYPYVAAKGVCNTGAERTNIYAKSRTAVGRTVNAMKAAVEKQAVGIAVMANQNAFRYYAGGVMEGCLGNRLDHEIVLVGWG